MDARKLVMLVSTRSRLCVLTTARDMDGLAERFQESLAEVLQALLDSETAIQRERLAMAEMRYGLPTGTVDGRSVLERRSLSGWNLYSPGGCADRSVTSILVMCIAASPFDTLG